MAVSLAGADTLYKHGDHFCGRDISWWREDLRRAPEKGKHGLTLKTVHV